MIPLQLKSIEPAATYIEAIERIKSWRDRDAAEEIRPDSRSCWMTHGYQTATSVVLFHGYTNSPKQFHRLGKIFFQQGFNVLIPRAPYHGHCNRLTTATQKITADKLLAFLHESVDAAQGLGEQVIVAGLSMGGVLAGWAGQTRSDVRQAVMISAALGVQAVPAFLTPLVVRLTLALPNRFRWWDDELRDRIRPPLHAYPRFSTHGLAHILRLSLQLQAAARKSPPKAGSVLVVTNPSDESVDNAAAEQLVKNWRSAGAQNVSVYQFEASHKLRHDLIDPDQLAQQTELVYPILKELILQG